MKKKLKNIKKMAVAGLVASPLDKIGNIAGTVSNAVLASSGFLGPLNGVGAALSGIGKVASAIPGPYGQIASSVLGIAGGLSSAFTGASTDMATGDVTKGGILGNNSRANRIGKQIKIGLQDTMYAALNTNDINTDWYEQNNGTKTNVMTVSKGGKIPVYLDNNETFTTPLGYGGIVPNNGNGTDTHLYQLPEGSRVYSEDLKDKNGVSFSLKAKPFLKALNNKQTDLYALNTKKLAQSALSDIYNELELMKLANNIKDNKYKTIKTAANGSTITNKFYQDLYSKAPSNDSNYQNWLNQSNESLLKQVNKGDINSLTNTPGYSYTNPWDRTRTTANQGLMDNVTADINSKETTTNTGKPNYLNYIDLALSSLGSLAPVISNLNEKSESVPMYTNPNTSTVNRLIGDMRYNIDPMLRLNLRNYATATYNTNQVNTNTGMNMAERSANMYNKTLADTSTYSDKVNRDNGYITNYANMLYQSGNDWMNNMKDWDNLNAYNRSSARNIRRTGLSQLSQYLQGRQLMNNQMAKDRSLTPALLEYLQGVLPSNTLSDIYKTYYNK